MSNWCIAKGVTSKATIVSVLVRNYEMTGKDAESIAGRILEVMTHGASDAPILLVDAFVSGKKCVIVAEPGRFWQVVCGRGFISKSYPAYPNHIEESCFQ